MPMIDAQPNCLTSLAHMRYRLDITSAYEDATLDVINMCINAVSDHFDLVCGRELKYGSYTEYYDGMGQPLLFVRHWPIVSVTYLYDDTDRQYNSDDLLYNVPGDSAQDEYEIMNVNRPYGNNGIIRRIGGIFCNGQNNIKIVYKGGYSEFIITPRNNKLDVNLGGSEVNLTLTNGKYNADTLATHLEAVLDAADDDFTVSYDSTIHRFTLTKGSGTFSLLWNTGSNTTESNRLADLLGFDSDDDDTGALTYTSDYAVVGVPSSLEFAAQSYVHWLYTANKEKWLGVDSESRGDQAWTMDFSRAPTFMQRMLTPFKSHMVR